MTPAEQSKFAAQAGIESGECFPGDTPWRRRFVDLLEDAKRREMCAGRWIDLEIMELVQAENAALREALSYYAESSNWRREVHTIGLRKAWKKPAVASDRGGMARLVLMTMEGTK